MQAWEGLLGLCGRLRASRPFVLLLLVPNLLGIGYGYYYYWEAGQFDPASPFFRDPLWWPFVPDSPNAVLVCTVALLAWAFWRRRSALLDGLAFTAMVYVGLWTTTLFLAYPDELGTFELGSTNNVLFVTHLGMPLEALLLVPALRRDARRLAAPLAVAAWSVLNLWLDYGPVHLHPAPFLHGSGLEPPLPSAADHALHAASPWVMAVALLLYAWTVTARPAPEPGPAGP